MNITELTKYPVNIMIDMNLKDKLRIDIDYEGCDKEKVSKALEKGYNTLTPEEKVIYDLIYRKGLQPAQAEAVIDGGRYNSSNISSDINNHICKKMADNCGDLLDCFIYRKRYEPRSIDDCIDSPMPYPLGMLQAIGIDSAFLIDDEIYAPIDGDQLLGLNEFLKTLGAITRKYLQMYFCYGYTIKEISKINGISDISVVGNTLYEAIKSARSDIINKRMIMYGYNEWVNMKRTPHNLSAEEVNQYKYILDDYHFSKRTKFALTEAVGKDKFPSVANICDAVSIPYWWEPINGVGKAFATRAMNILKEFGYIDDSNPGYDGLTRNESNKPKKIIKKSADNKESISVHTQKIVSILDDGTNYLTANIDNISDKERRILKERLTLLEKVLEGSDKLANNE